ncbi:MAG TPA: sialidase family protein [Pyrinomonadaceae bacterium]
MLTVNRKSTKTMLLTIGQIIVIAGVVRAQNGNSNVPLVVGPNVQISQAYSNLEHGENLTAASPENSGQLLSCAVIFRPDSLRFSDQYCYASFDSGKSWQPSVKIEDGVINSDPAVIYGQGNDAYSVTLFEPSSQMDLEALGHTDTTAAWATVVYKSIDSGRTFKESARFEFIDRPYMTIDRSKGRYAGRLYIVGKERVSGISGASIWSMKLFHSDDGGKTFQGPTVIAGPVPPNGVVASFGCQVLSDGSLVILFSARRQATPQGSTESGPDSELYVIRSRDGGQTFSRPQKVGDRRYGSGEGGFAADTASSLFRDRLYAVWPNNTANGRAVLFAYSADRGNSWSKPATINDDRPEESDKPGVNHMLPAVAVNKHGAVLVAWYDRRNAKDDLGWQLRAAASLDGGETFSPSIPVAEVATKYSRDYWRLWLTDLTAHGTMTFGIRLWRSGRFAGDTSGLAADTDGIFHPTWIDNRTGVPQLWTAAVRIKGMVARHGGGGLEDFEDISKQAMVKLSDPTFDQTTGLLKVTAQLQNVSKDILKGPVKIRVLKIVPALGVAQITNADNGQSDAGAVWDFSSVIPKEGLAPMTMSEAKTLTFRITDLRQVSNRPGQVRDELFTWDVRIYARGQK